jgi:hypothetical protein
MGHAWLWRTGLVLLVLMWGCEEKRPSTEPRTPPPIASSQPMSSESPAPPQGDAHEVSTDAGADSVPDWSPTEAAGIPGSVLSPDGRFALVVPGGDRVRYIDIYDVASRRRLTRITTDKSVVVRASSSHVRWTAGNHILLSWSAGTNVFSAIVHGTDGKMLLQVDGSGMELSPSRRYLASYPTLFADVPTIEVYDLSLGRKVAERSASEGTFWVVDEIEWKGQQLVALCRDLKEQVQEVRIDLDARP